jgi:hypothetical protein
MAFGKSGDKIMQIAAVITAIYVMFIGYKHKEWLLFAIGLCIFLYDGYLAVFEKQCVCK